METAAKPTLLVVVVNYRTADLTIDCLRSLEPEIGPRGDDARVVVTDNASGDGSPGRIEAAIRENGWASWAEFRPLEKNGGFAFGNNAAIRPFLESGSPPRYVLLLNPDTIVRPGAVAALVEFMDANPAVGIAGSRLEDPDGSPQRSAFRFYSALGELEGAMKPGRGQPAPEVEGHRPGSPRRPMPDRLGRRRQHDRPPRGF